MDGVDKYTRRTTTTPHPNPLPDKGARGQLTDQQNLGTTKTPDSCETGFLCAVTHLVESCFQEATPD